MAKASAAPRMRDRDATEARLIDALERVLSRDGFRGLGVNAVAREAGVDKVLIYRYFGDLDGLIEKFGQRLGLWVGAASSASASDGAYAARVQELLRTYLASLRSNAALRQILAWELVDSSPLMRKLDASRSRAVGAWFAKARGDSSAPAGVDAPAVNALLLAAMHHLALREQSIGTFAGMDLRDPASWVRLEQAAERLLGCAYPAEGKKARIKRTADRP
jgi:AcrR family transcriptional regulator